MDDVRYVKLIKKMFKTGLSVVRLGSYAQMNACSLYVNVKTVQPGRKSELLWIRLLNTKMYGDRNVESVPVERMASPAAVKLHALDDKCIIIPNIKEYKGAYRYITTSDVPTIIGRNSAYIRCPDVLTALSLSTWLNSTVIISAIQAEFKRMSSLKYMNKMFFETIPVPSTMLEPDFVEDILKKEEKMAKLYLEIKNISNELDDTTKHFVTNDVRIF